MSKVTLGTYGELNLLPMPPEAPVREDLEWKTDITESYDSTEERIRIRNHPRQRFRYKLPANATLTARAFNVTWGGTVSRWAVPLWTEAQGLGALASGLAILNVDTTEGDFRAGAWALLWQNPNLWEVIEVDSLTDSTLTPVDLTVNVYTQAFLMPLRISRVTQTVTKDTNGYNTVVALIFDIEDNTTLIGAAPPQFLGDDIYYDEGLLSGNTLSEKLQKRAIVMDEDVGVVSFQSPWPNTQTSRPHRSIMEDRAAVWAYREWLHRRAGRHIQFWQPSFESDIRLTSTGTIVSSITAFRDDYLIHATNRVHIALEDADGTWYPRTVVDAVPLTASSMRLDLDTPVNVPADTVVRVSYLGLKRLEPDRVELNWFSGGAAQSSVRVVELTP